jgi:hypothetical protein
MRHDELDSIVNFGTILPFLFGLVKQDQVCGVFIVELSPVIFVSISSLLLLDESRNSSVVSQARGRDEISVV